ncbi:MAG: hypothetical protein HGA47_06600 [Zoogloea sp.]|nr:hypothetical protein [Zoogloea sp.]
MRASTPPERCPARQAASGGSLAPAGGGTRPALAARSIATFARTTLACFHKHPARPVAAFRNPYKAWLLALFLVCGQAAAQQVRILVQRSPLAGFQYYAGDILWDEMREGDTLELVREPANPHDAHAVRVEWRGQKLGYLPRAENAPVAAEMDRGTRIVARIGRLVRHPDPWKRIRVDVFVNL